MQIMIIPTLNHNAMRTTTQKRMRKPTQQVKHTQTKIQQKTQQKLQTNTVQQITTLYWLCFQKKLYYIPHNFTQLYQKVYMCAQVYNTLSTTTKNIIQHYSKYYINNRQASNPHKKHTQL